jgi:hypothetical protein
MLDMPQNAPEMVLAQAARLVNANPAPIAVMKGQLPPVKHTQADRTIH